MKRQLKLYYYRFWTGFPWRRFEWFFPFIKKRYDFVISDDNPDIAIFGIFTSRPPPPENCLKVFFSHEAPKKSGRGPEGLKGDPNLAGCDFSIAPTVWADNPNHFTLPNWAMPGLGRAKKLIKPARDQTDWQKIAADKLRFCNFISSHDVPFRNQMFKALDARRHVDAPGGCMTNRKRIAPAFTRDWLWQREKFIRESKFTLAVENTIWPGYHSEKLVDPMLYDSIPIYMGDPLAAEVFNTRAYFDLTQYRDRDEMIEHVLTVADDDKLYLDMLAQPKFRDNKLPLFCDEGRIIAFFDKIFAAANARVNGDAL